MAAPRSPQRPPRRPPLRVYRRRRAAVLLVALIAVVAVLAVTLWHPWSRSAPEAAASPSVLPGVSAGAPTSAAASPTVAATAKDGAPCTTAQIDVRAKTDRTTYGSGVLPKLQFTIVNTGTNTCALDVGTDKQVYSITSGSERYWVSTDCQTAARKTLVLLVPGKALTSAPLTWHRTRSDKSACTATLSQVPAGGASYHFTVSVGGIEAKNSVQFLLY